MSCSQLLLVAGRVLRDLLGVERFETLADREAFDWLRGLSAGCFVVAVIR